METLVAVFRVKNNKDSCSKYGWTWIKKEGDAKTACEKKVATGETLTEIWICKWKDVPSKYKLVFGHPTPENKVPNLDMAEDLRNTYLKRGGRKPKNKFLTIVNKQDKPRVRLIPEYIMFTVEEA